MTELKAISDLKSGRSSRRTTQSNLQLGKSTTVAEFEKLDQEEII
jgi:hypothetical protein